MRITLPVLKKTFAATINGLKNLIIRSRTEKLAIFEGTYRGLFRFSNLQVILPVKGGIPNIDETIHLQ